MTIPTTPFIHHDSNVSVAFQQRRYTFSYTTELTAAILSTSPSDMLPSHNIFTMIYNY